MASAKSLIKDPLHEGLEEVEGHNRWIFLAQKHWLRSKKTIKANPEVIKKEIWDVLKDSDFDFASLLALDSLQLLEKYIVSMPLRMAFIDFEQILMAGF